MCFSLQEKFHLKHNLSGVFVDSYAVYYPEDEGQQSNFSFYTDLLWQFAESTISFDFKTIEDILEENQVCQRENDCLNGIIEGKLMDLEKVRNKNHILNVSLQTREKFCSLNDSYCKLE